MSESPRSHSAGLGRISRLVDSVVRLPGGTPMGEVDELLVDLRTGRVTYIIVQTPQGDRRQIPWSSVTFRDGAFKLCTLHRA